MYTILPPDLRLAVVTLAVGAIVYLLFGDGFVSLLAQTMVIAGVFVWRTLYPPPPAE
jgi:hypothetical protein